MISALYARGGPIPALDCFLLNMVVEEYSY
jgi:hypothetical protein